MLYAAFTFAAMVVVARLLFVDMRLAPPRAPRGSLRDNSRNPWIETPTEVEQAREAYIAGDIDVEQFEARLDRIMLKRVPTPAEYLTLRERRMLTQDHVSDGTMVYDKIVLFGGETVEYIGHEEV